MRVEEWKDIKGYEGLYQVSNLGNVKSLKRNTTHERILKQRKNRDGYLYVNLCKEGKTKTKKIHRLVAEHFISNDENKYSVNHKDGIKNNNNVENLEWATSLEQAHHAVKMGLWKWTDDSKNKLRKTLMESGLKNKNKNDHKGHKFGTVCVAQKDDNGNVIKIWDSISDASRELCVPVSHIVRVCKGIRKHARNYRWSYYKGGGE